MSESVSQGVLCTRDIELSFGGTRALRGVSCELRWGEILGVIGSNGAGKSTLLNCITGYYAPDGGVIEVGGAVYDRVDPTMLPELKVARTFQHPSVVDELTVRENVAFGALAHQRTAGGPLRTATRLLRPLDKRIADDVLPLFGLTGVGSRSAGELSYAQRKMVEMARAVAAEPRMLLLDEPASGMNGEERGELARVLRELHRELSLSLLVIDHSMRFISTVCDRVIAMHLGEVIAEGETERVLSDQIVIDSYLGVTTSHSSDGQPVTGMGDRRSTT